MIPIRDENRSLTSPHVTRILIIVNIVVFFVTLLTDLTGSNWLGALFGGSQSIHSVALTYGVTPSDLRGGMGLYTLFTSMFLHGTLIHLGVNMLFLFVFGDNVEDAFGHLRYSAFYLLAGIVGSLAHVGWWVFSGSLPAENLPTIGASGAISGVLGAYLLLYPRAKIVTVIFFGWIWLIALPAIVFLGLWFAYQFLKGYLALEGGVAYWAHIGGFVAGMLFGAVLRGRRRKRVL